MLYGLPDVAIICATPPPEDQCREVANLLEILVHHMRTKKADKDSVKEGQTAADIWGARFNGSLGSPDAALHGATEEEAQLLPMMGWFYRNFLDQEIGRSNVLVMNFALRHGRMKKGGAVKVKPALRLAALTAAGASTAADAKRLPKEEIEKTLREIGKL